MKAEQVIAATLDSPAVQLATRIEQRVARIAVIGQGYVGLPLAVELARSGFNVTGLDVDSGRVEMLNHAESPTPDVAAGELRALRDAGKYSATTDTAGLASCDIVFICVPTPLRKSKDPDISFVLHAAGQVAGFLHRGQLIILESTTYPGTTQEVLLPLFEESGFEAGRDFFLAFSPERIDPANRSFRMHDIPKVVGGVTETCAGLARLIYGKIVSTVATVSSPKVAEMAKLYENVFRSVNIALANELAMMCRNLDINTREVIDAAATKPFGFLPFQPGPGVGGHCISIDSAYLAWKMRLNGYDARFIHLAEEINRSMPAYVINLLADALNRRHACINGADILALGVAYKPGVSDTRESPALEVIKQLEARGAAVTYADPHVPVISLNGEASMHSVEVNDELLERADGVLILTDHAEFDYRRVAEKASLIIDTRNATWGIDTPSAEIVRL